MSMPFTSSLNAAVRRVGRLLGALVVATAGSTILLVTMLILRPKAAPLAVPSAAQTSSVNPPIVVSHPSPEATKSEPRALSRAPRKLAPSAAVGAKLPAAAPALDLRTVGQAPIVSGAGRVASLGRVSEGEAVGGHNGVEPQGARASGPGRATLGHDLEELVPIHPPYPRAAQAMGSDGWVRVLVGVDERGRVESLKVLHVHGHPSFAKSVVQDSVHWRFRPRMRDGRPTKNLAAKTIFFQLDG